MEKVFLPSRPVAAQRDEIKEKREKSIRAQSYETQSY
jgi:hypothetical protein